MWRDSANAYPHYHKLHARLPRFGWAQGSTHQSAMVEPHPGSTAFLIAVTPTPSKFKNELSI
jgi:hypothetical protein